MNLLKNVKLTPVSLGVAKRLAEYEEEKNDIVNDSTEVPITDEIVPSIEVVPSVEKTTESLPSQEVLIPLDPEARSSRKPEHIPANIYISHMISSEDVVTYRIYLTSAINKVLPYVIQFIENAPEDCKIILILSSMNIDRLGVGALLSTIAACKATITTHLNSTTSLADMAVWASGDTLTVSEVAFVLLRNLCTGTSGNIEDMKVHLKLIERTQARIKTLLLSKSIITEEEAISIFEDNKVAFLTGTALQKRIIEK